MRDYHQEDHESALHELNEAIAVLIDVLKEQYRTVSPPLKDQQYRDVELNDVVRMRLQSALFSLPFPSEQVVEFSYAVEGGLLAAIGQILADG